MRRLILSFVWLAVIVNLQIARPEAQTGHDFFQQGLAKERGEGNPQEAIRLYEQAMKAAGSDRALAARALLQIAGCYETLGRPEAKATYDRLIREFGDQTQSVAEARARLKALTSSSPARSTGPSLRQLDTWATGEAAPPLAVMSPDGRYLAGGRFGLTSPNLFVKTLATGETRWLDGNAGVRLKLTPGTKVDVAALAKMPAPPLQERVVLANFVWSSDSRRIAYQKIYPPSTPGGRSEYEIRSIGVDGTGATVLHARQSARQPEPLDWSADGRHLAVLFWNTEDWTGEHELALLSLADSSTRDLGTFRWDDLRWCGFSFQPRFSPDGRHLAYSTGSPDRTCDINVMATDGSGARPLIQHTSADDHLIDWTPAGNILFTSNRGGTTDLWLARMREGRVEGLPTLLRQDIGALWPGTLTAAGDLHFRTPRPMVGPGASYYLAAPLDDIYVAEIDPASGALSTPALVAPSHPGQNHVATWSADGRYLLYSTRDLRATAFQTITILSVETGEEGLVRLRPTQHIGNGRQWLAADGRTLLTSMPSGTSDGQILHRVNIETGETTPLTSKGGAELTPRPGANEIAYFGVPGRRTLVVQDLATGAERTLHDAGDGHTLASLAFSADGAQLTFRQTGGGATRIMVAPVADRLEPREIYQSKGVQVTLRSHWSPDGRFIYFVERPRAGSNEELWRVPVAGGAAERLLSTNNWLIWMLSIHPNGRYLAFTKGEQPSADVFKNWMLENFLPESELRPVRAAGARP